MAWLADEAEVPSGSGSWCRLAAAAPIRPLAQELRYATGGALKRKKNDQTKVNK